MGSTQITRPARHVLLTTNSVVTETLLVTSDIVYCNLQFKSRRAVKVCVGARVVQRDAAVEKQSERESTAGQLAVYT